MPSKDKDLLVVEKNTCGTEFPVETISRATSNSSADTPPAQTSSPTDSSDSFPAQEANTCDSPAQEPPQSQDKPASVFESGLPPDNSLDVNLATSRSQSLPARWGPAYSDSQTAPFSLAEAGAPNSFLHCPASPADPISQLIKPSLPGNISPDASAYTSSTLVQTAKKAGCSTEDYLHPQAPPAHPQSFLRARTPPAPHSTPFHPSPHRTSKPNFNHPSSKPLRATEPTAPEANDDSDSACEDGELDDEIVGYQDQYEKGDDAEHVCLRSIHEACNLAIRGPCLAPVKPEGRVVGIRTDLEALWARELCDKASHAEVWDISRRGAKYTPNATPMSRDVEEGWTSSRIFDFIVIRAMSGWVISRCIRD